MCLERKNDSEVKVLTLSYQMGVLGTGPGASESRRPLSQSFCIKWWTQSSIKRCKISSRSEKNDLKENYRYMTFGKVSFIQSDVQGCGTQNNLGCSVFLKDTSTCGGTGDWGSGGWVRQRALPPELQSAPCSGWQNNTWVTKLPKTYIQNIYKSIIYSTTTVEQLLTRLKAAPGKDPDCN